MLHTGWPPVPLERRPGFSAARLAQLAGEAADIMQLDLRGRTIYTEAATGAYVVTPVLAALAGAERVTAVTRTTQYGTVDDVIAETQTLAELANVRDRITITIERSPADVAEADIVTNSGHVRPIDAEFVRWMKPEAVVPLMFEAWEIQAGRFDVDLDALHLKGIGVAGTNECHPSVGVFEHLGPMVMAQMIECGVAVRGAHVVVLCDNPFGPHIADGLRRVGAEVWIGEWSDVALEHPPRPDVVLVALRPRTRYVVDRSLASVIAENWSGAIVLQFWGDIDRSALASAGVSYWPVKPPTRGHMAILPSAIGPEPIVRLQAGGLRVAQVLLTSAQARSAADLEYLDAL